MVLCRIILPINCPTAPASFPLRRLVKPTSKYQKHIYWVAPEEAGVLQSDLEKRGVKVSTAKGVVCTPLDEVNRITIVPPGVWNETCSRQGSWYRASERNGLYLVVSSFDVDGMRDRKEGVITRSDFVPSRAATPEEKEELIRNPDFASKIPAEWGSVGEREKRIYLRWAARLGSDVKEYPYLFLTHTANHANFLKPRFFTEHNGIKVPYSIDISAHVCSCCLELFQIVGKEQPRKLVRPCPGAVIFARLKPNQFLLVERP